MTGRMSLEQAKAIRAKRELAQELGTLCVAPNAAIADSGCRGRAEL